MCVAATTTTAVGTTEKEDEEEEEEKKEEEDEEEEEEDEEGRGLGRRSKLLDSLENDEGVDGVAENGKWRDTDKRRSDEVLATHLVDSSGGPAAPVV
nr:unnamed protein product [Spirometra erinaceieuropaei]